MNTFYVFLISKSWSDGSSIDDFEAGGIFANVFENLELYNIKLYNFVSQKVLCSSGTTTDISHSKL